MDVCLW